MPKYLMCAYVDSECMAFARSLFVFRHLLALFVCCCLVHTHIYTSLFHTTHFGSAFQKQENFMAHPLTVDKDGRMFRFQSHAFFRSASRNRQKWLQKDKN